MAHADLNDDLLDGLDDRARRQLYDRLALEFNASTARRNADFSTAELDVWKAAAEASNSGTGNRRQLERWLEKKSSASRRDFAERVEDFEAYLTAASDGTLRKTERSELRRVVLNALVTAMRGWITASDQAVPIIPSTIMNNLHRAPAAVEAAFPGYARAKLLHRVLLARAA